MATQRIDNSRSHTQLALLIWVRYIVRRHSRRVSASKLADRIHNGRPSCNVIGPITITPAPNPDAIAQRRRAGGVVAVVTCWLIQQWRPMDSALLMVATPFG